MPILTAVKEMLEAEGLVVGHLVIAYDGGEAGPGGGSYVLGQHFWPNTEEHARCHTFVVQSALRVVGPPRMEDEPGYITQYLPDGSIVVVPGALAQEGDDGDG